MKKKLFVIICLTLLLVITGCSRSAADVKLLNEKQVTRLAKTYFGKATYNGIIESDSDKIVYSFKDDTYGFEYVITSYKKSISVDGSNFGYTAKTSSNFGNMYYDYIIDSLSDDVTKIENKYNVSINYNDGWRKIESTLTEMSKTVSDCNPNNYAFYSVYSNSSEDREKAGEELASLVKKTDSRKYFKNCGIWLRENELNYNNVYPRRGIVPLN